MPAFPSHKCKESGVNAFGNYINGEFVESKTRKTFPNINPANFDEVVGTFQASNEADVADACSAAVAAQSEWAAMPATKRGEYLFKAADLLASKLPQLGEEMSRAQSISFAISAAKERGNSRIAFRLNARKCSATPSANHSAQSH